MINTFLDAEFRHPEINSKLVRNADPIDKHQTPPTLHGTGLQRELNLAETTIMSMTNLD